MRIKPKKDLSGKKGNAFLDTVIFAALFFVLAVAWVTSGLISNDLSKDILNDPDMANSSKQMIETNNVRYPTLFDNLFVFAFALFWILVLVASYNIETLPIFFVISIILLIFVLVFSAIITNTWEEVMSEDEYSEIIEDYSKMNWIMSHLLETTIVIGFSILFVLYAKNR